MSNDKEEESAPQATQSQPNPPSNQPPAMPAVVGALNATDLENITEQTLQEAEAHLEDLVKRKRNIDKQLTNLEASIYAFEGSYLEETAGTGNIIRGFEGYLGGRSQKSRGRINEHDRLFSMSSTTYQKSLEIKNRDSLYRPIAGAFVPKPKKNPEFRD